MARRAAYYRGVRGSAALATVPLALSDGHTPARGAGGIDALRRRAAAAAQGGTP